MTPHPHDRRPNVFLTGQRLEREHAQAAVEDLRRRCAESGSVVLVECVRGVFLELARATRESEDAFGPLSVAVDGPVIKAVFGFDHGEPGA